MAPCCKDLYTIPRSWKHPSSCMASILTDMSPLEHVWDALYRLIQQCVPVPANIQQLRTAIEEEWTIIPQATINNLINSMQRRCVALREVNGGQTRCWLIFGPPNTVKLHILEWPFIVASLRHTCAIIIWYAKPVRWMDYLGKGDVFTNTDFWTIFEIVIGLLCSLKKS